MDVCRGLGVGAAASVCVPLFMDASRAAERETAPKDRTRIGSDMFINSTENGYLLHQCLI